MAQQNWPSNVIDWLSPPHTERIEKFPRKRFDGRLENLSLERGYSLLAVAINDVRYDQLAPLKGFLCSYVFEEC